MPERKDDRGSAVATTLGGLGGRPPTTTPEAIAAVALRLFDQRGFASTTVDDIAAELGVGRRTVFRYFPSKNDIVWGDFDQVLQRLRNDLAADDAGLPLRDVLVRAVISSNSYPAEQRDELRTRMTLITRVPALQAHSMLRYAAWRAVIAEFVAEHSATRPSSLPAQTIGHVALGVSVAAFSHWVDHPESELGQLLSDAWSSVMDLDAPGLLGQSRAVNQPASLR